MFEPAAAPHQREVSTSLAFCWRQRCTCLLDSQVHSLLNVVRPDRQTLLFSATLPRRIEALVAEALSNPVRISVGLLGAANADVTQRVEILKGEWTHAQTHGVLPLLCSTTDAAWRTCCGEGDDRAVQRTVKPVQQLDAYALPCC